MPLQPTRSLRGILLQLTLEVVALVGVARVALQKGKKVNFETWPGSAKAGPQGVGLTAACVHIQQLASD